MEIERVEVLRLAGLTIRALAREAGCTAPHARDALLGRRGWTPRFENAWRSLEVERRAMERAAAIVIKSPRSAKQAAPAAAAQTCNSRRLLAVLAKLAGRPHEPAPDRPTVGA